MRSGRNYRLIVALASLVLVAAAISTYLHRKQDPQLVVAVADELPWVRGLLTRYSQEFELRELPYEKLKSELTESFKKPKDKGEFDAVLVDQPWLVEFGKDLEPKRLEQPSLLPQKVRDAVDPHHDGKALGVPYTGNFEIFAINRRLLGNQQGPENWRTWDDVVKIAREWRRTESSPYALRASADSSSMTDEFMPVYWGENSKALKAVDILSALVQRPGGSQQVSPPIFPVLGSPEISSLILRGKAVMGIVWSDWAMQMGEAEPDLVKRDVVFGRMPGGVPELGIWLLSIPKNAPHAAQAEAFIKFAQEQSQLRQSVLDGNPPIRGDLLQDPELAAKYGYFFDAQKESMKNSRERPQCPDWNSRNETQIANALRDLYFDNGSAEAAAKEIDDALSKCLPPTGR